MIKFTTDKVLNMLMENILPIHRDDFPKIQLWSTDLAEKTGRKTSDIELSEGGFISYTCNHVWYCVLVLDKEKYEKFKKEHLQNLSFDEKRHIDVMYKYDPSRIVTIIDSLNEKSDLVNSIRDFLHDHLICWFENFSNRGYRYDQKYIFEHIVEPNDILKERLMLSLIAI